MVIRSTGESLGDELLPEIDLREVASRTVTAADRAAVLVHRLMVYAECGGPLPGKVEVDPVVGSVCRDLRASFMGRCELDQNLAGGALSIYSRVDLGTSVELTLPVVD